MADECERARARHELHSRRQLHHDLLNVQVYLRRTDSHVGLGARGNPEKGCP